MANLKMDFRARKDDNRGIYYAETKRALVYLGMHERLDDIFKTINHETYHHCFAEAGEADDMDEMDTMEEVKDEVEESVEETVEESTTDVHTQLQERFKKLANIVKG